MDGFQVVDRRKQKTETAGVVILGAPRVVRNSSSATRDNVVVYVCSPKGDIELAPDNRMTQSQLDRIGYKGWKRCEAVGTKEIERLSVKLSKQLWEQKKQMKIGQHLREKADLDQLMVRCRLRMAQCYSKNDQEMNKRILQRAANNENMLMRLIASEFDPSIRTSGLEMEVRAQSTSKVANIAQKRQGVA